MADTPPAKPRPARKTAAKSTSPRPATGKKAAVAATAGSTASTRGSAAGQTLKSQKDKLREQADALKEQASRTARSAAVTGKAKAGSAMQGLSRMIEDSAGGIDERLGNQYGDYARYAAEAIASAAATLDRKDIDELVNDARDFVRKSPALAIGTAAIVGFVLMRLAKSARAPAPEQESEA